MRASANSGSFLFPMIVWPATTCSTREGKAKVMSYEDIEEALLITHLKGQRSFIVLLSSTELAPVHLRHCSYFHTSNGRKSFEARHLTYQQHTGASEAPVRARD